MSKTKGKTSWCECIHHKKMKSRYFKCCDKFFPSTHLHNVSLLVFVPPWKLAQSNRSAAGRRRTETWWEATKEGKEEQQKTSLKSVLALRVSRSQVFSPMSLHFNDWFILIKKWWYFFSLGTLSRVSRRKAAFIKSAFLLLFVDKIVSFFGKENWL